MVAKGVENRFVREVPAGLTGDVAKAVAIVRSAPGVVSATPVSEDEMRTTLQRWLGNAAELQNLPVPALVTVELRPGVQAVQLQTQVVREFPGANVVSEVFELRPLLSSLHVLQWLAFSLVLLVAIATSAAIILAARGALDTHRSTIEIMHGIGATDRQLTRLFERKIAADAAIGAAIGSAAAAVALLLAGSGSALAGELAGKAPLGMSDLIVLAVTPLALVALAIFVARWAVLKALRETL